MNQNQQKHQDYDVLQYIKYQHTSSVENLIKESYDQFQALRQDSIRSQGISQRSQIMSPENSKNRLSTQVLNQRHNNSMNLIQNQRDQQTLAIKIPNQIYDVTREFIQKLHECPQSLRKKQYNASDRAENYGFSKILQIQQTKNNENESLITDQNLNNNSMEEMKIPSQQIKRNTENIHVQKPYFKQYTHVDQEKAEFASSVKGDRCLGFSQFYPEDNVLGSQKSLFNYRNSYLASANQDIYSNPLGQQGQHEELMQNGLRGKNTIESPQKQFLSRVPYEMDNQNSALSTNNDQHTNADYHQSFQNSKDSSLIDSSRTHQIKTFQGASSNKIKTFNKKEFNTSNKSNQYSIPVKTNRAFSHQISEMDSFNIENYMENLLFPQSTKEINSAQNSFYDQKISQKSNNRPWNYIPNNVASVPDIFFPDTTKKYPHSEMYSATPRKRDINQNFGVNNSVNEQYDKKSPEKNTQTDHSTVTRRQLNLKQNHINQKNIEVELLELERKHNQMTIPKILNQRDILKRGGFTQKSKVYSKKKEHNINQQSEILVENIVNRGQRSMEEIIMKNMDPHKVLIRQRQNSLFERKNGPRPPPPPFLLNQENLLKPNKEFRDDYSTLGNSQIQQLYKYAKTNNQRNKIEFYQDEISLSLPTKQKKGQEEIITKQTKYIQVNKQTNEIQYI